MRSTFVLEDSTLEDAAGSSQQISGIFSNWGTSHSSPALKPVIQAISTWSVFCHDPVFHCVVGAQNSRRVLAELPAHHTGPDQETTIVTPSLSQPHLIDALKNPSHPLIDASLLANPHDEASRTTVWNTHMSSVRFPRALVHPHGACWAQSLTDCVVTIIAIVPRCSVFCVIGHLCAASSTKHLKSERKYVADRNTHKRAKRKEKQTQVLKTERFEWSATAASQERYPRRARPVSGTS